MNKNDVYDFVIVGSGFGGSVSAMRLAQKGYKVAILEMGKKWENKDFPKTNWNVRKYLWLPILRCFGIQKISFLNKVMVLHGIGVGGGSLVYANTLMQPPDHVFAQSFWPKGISWKDELKPHYAMAKKMLGVVTNQILTDGELALKKVGEKLGVAETFHATEVGIYFGKKGEVHSDPFFSGKGPAREGCQVCGACMIGCPTGAKNTLDKNYLYFAQKWGVDIVPETKVEKIIPTPDGYQVSTRSMTAWFKQSENKIQAKNIILSAGVLGTMEILFKNRDIFKTLPHVSSQLGHIVRSNGESLLGATTFKKDLDLSVGIAIGAAIHPDAETKIETVRYPAGSDLMRFLAVPLTGDGSLLLRPLKLFINCLIKFPQIVKLYTIRDWARSTIILLVMQSIETKMRLVYKHSLWSLGFKSIQGETEKGEAIPAYLPVAQKSAQLLEKELNGFAQNVASEVLLQVPATAHILGGAVMGSNSSDGVVDTHHQLFNYPGLFVMDASVIPSNLAVNPSLTICALAERFASLFPVKDTAAMQERQIHLSSG